MIYIFTAFYAEAELLIKHYKLNKITETTGKLRFDAFSNDKIMLIITGTGSINAATAVGNVAGVYGLGKNDIIINVGSCCANESVSSVFMINKIIQESTGKEFYPDMLIRTGIDEAALVTVEKPVTDIQSCNLKNAMCDMEAAAIYQAGAFFVGPHRMFFIKIVSDKGNKINADIIKAAIKNAEKKLISAIDIIAASKTTALAVEKNIEQCVQKLSRDMHCSKVMTDQLRQLFKYLHLCEVDYMTVVESFYEQQKLPCSSKKEGKVCLDELKKRLL